MLKESRDGGMEEVIEGVWKKERNFRKEESGGKNWEKGIGKW